MPDKKPNTQLKLKQLRQQYAEKLPERIRELEQQWLALAPDPQSAQYENLVREFHSLAGSGSSYGFPQITVLSREIENILLEAKTTINYGPEQLKTEINSRLSSLKQAATEEPS